MGGWKQSYGEKPISCIRCLDHVQIDVADSLLARGWLVARSSRLVPVTKISLIQFHRLKWLFKFGSTRFSVILTVSFQSRLSKSAFKVAFQSRLSKSTSVGNQRKFYPQRSLHLKAWSEWPEEPSVTVQNNSWLGSPGLALLPWPGSPDLKIQAWQPWSDSSGLTALAWQPSSAIPRETLG